MDIKFGVCTDLDKMSQLSEAGFDYIEPAAYIFAQATEEEFKAIRKKVAACSDISCEACNFFYPLDFHVTGEGINTRKIYAYIDKTIERADILGVRNITIGSGPARKVPDGFPKEDAFRQFGDQIHYAGELAARHGITITIEPIRPASTNLIINLAEGTSLAKYVNLSNVKTMADINQMVGSGDTIDMVYQYGDYIKHLHTIDTKNHCYPVNPEDTEQIALIKAYLTVNPGGRITVEGAPFTTMENAHQCLKTLKNYVAKTCN
jgi:sugar phosphate isomerase/epimerase